MPTIYKICSGAEWQAAERAGVYEGSAVDRQDGYIHFSAAAQVVETAARYFTGMTDLVLVAVDADRFGEQLKWEPSRGGVLFPHLYGLLPVATVLWVRPLPLDRAEGHKFPPLE